MYKLLQEAGIPGGILDAYKDFQETLEHCSRGTRGAVRQADIDSAGRCDVDDDYLVASKSMGSADERDGGEANNPGG